MSMIVRCLLIIVVFVAFMRYACSEESETPNNGERKLPTVFIAILIRNKAHTLPYFLSFLEKLTYPKDRLALWIRSDHNEDESLEILQTWLNRTASSYHSCDFRYETDPLRHPNETSITDWPNERFAHVIQLKEQALEEAKRKWADYIFFLDADVFLTEPDTLQHLTSHNLPIIAPMLLSEGLYSNFWCAMSENFYYERTDDYKTIYNFGKTGQFAVPMVHSAVLIDLNVVASDLLTFDPVKLVTHQYSLGLSKLYDGPVDDIIIFAISAKTAGVEMMISNEHTYGYIMAPLDKDDLIERDYQQLINLKLNMVNDMNREIGELSEDLQKYVHYPEKDRITLDHIYMVNLLRRPERRIRMESNFKELGLDVEHFPAVDGRQLNLEIIKEMGIRFLPDYEDPYNHRPMTMGEIGCFLSHYKIWERMVALGQNEVLILEDDIRFEAYFKEKAIRVLEEARQNGKWDLIYFGRKRLHNEAEPLVEGTENLVQVAYSYWTLGYVISLSGAQKLLAVEPLQKLIPVDEFLPVMFDRHPNETWSRAFTPRNLIAYSVAPLLLFPTHYTGDHGYISDTEDSELTPIKFDEESDAQLKSDKARDLSDNYHKSNDFVGKKRDECEL